MPSQWPFAQPKNSAVITQRTIMDAGHPVLLVTHDADDHGWCFLDGGPFDTAQALVVALSTVVDLDPTLIELADLPPGWQATRSQPLSPWQRRSS